MRTLLLALMIALLPIRGWLGDAMAAGQPLPMALRAQRIWGVKERLFERLLPRITDAQAARLLQSAHAVDGIVKGLAFEGWPREGWQALRRLAVDLARPAPRADVPFLARLFQLRLGLGGPGLKVVQQVLLAEGAAFLAEQRAGLQSVQQIEQHFAVARRQGLQQLR